MSIRQFKTLVAIDEQGSFAAAAKALNLTQSAVGMQVTALETALDVALFDRKHRPPRLTAAGEIVLRRARAIVAQVDGIPDALAAARPYHGSFRLGAIPTVQTNLLPAGLMALRHRVPGLTINVVSGLSGLLLRQVAQGELDAAIMHKPNRLDDAFAWRDIAQQRVAVICPPDSTEENIEDVLTNHPYIRFNRAAWVASLIERRLAALGLNPDTRAEIESIEAIHLMIRLGFGFSILPDVGNTAVGNTAGGSPAGGGLPNAGPVLRLLDFGAPPIHRTVGLLSRKDTTKANARRAVGDVFAAVAGRQDAAGHGDPG